MKYLLQTSYIKLMDVWLLFGLVLPFVAFLLTIMEELLKNPEAKQERCYQVVMV